MGYDAVSTSAPPALERVPPTFGGSGTFSTAVDQAGDLDRAEALARTITDPDDQSGTLATVATAIARTGDLDHAAQFWPRCSSWTCPGSYGWRPFRGSSRQQWETHGMAAPVIWQECLHRCGSRADGLVTDARDFWVQDFWQPDRG